ncbi:hypothetical protein CVIRNUC_000901 [Coccomyxa viridis]|uniref:BZIP domain-containing protein n=1 Tax=Coccomyxa viridis TaxID=1274662 RepID=A0AAV1HRM5_9CHLO|nr:hypothetical protein CVIRNUC_000901 [Coccomyxa viridis]
MQAPVGAGRQSGSAGIVENTVDAGAGGFRPYDPSKGGTARPPVGTAPVELKKESGAQEMAMPMAMTKPADKTVPSPSITPSTAPSESTPAASASLDGRLASLPPASANTTHWNGQGLVTDRADWAGAQPHDAPAENESHLLSQRLESIGQRPSMPSQRLESLAGNLTSMMSSSNGASLDALRALGSINSAGIMPAAMQLAQRGAMGAYPAAMMQQQNMQQYLSHLPWMLRMQNTQGGMGNLFSSHLASDAGVPEANVSGGLPLSEADGMPSLSGMSPSDAAAFLQSTKKRKSGAGKSHSSGDNHMRYSDDEGDGMGNPDDLDDLEGGDVDKVKRRLAQNREAARKSRQRRKAYVQNLEEEVRNLRASKSGQPLGSGNSSSLGTGSYGGVATTLGLSPDANGLLNALITRLPPGSLSGPESGRISSQSLRSVARGSMGLAPADPLLRQNEEVLLAFDKWRAEHSATVLAVRQAVADASASDAALRPLVEEARGQLWTLFAMKKAVICSESVLIIMNMEHLLPAERLYSWLGGLRASDICGGVIHKLSESGLASQQRMKLEALRESLLQQENTLSRGYNELLGSLGQRASAQPVAPQALKEKRSWDSPEILGKLDAMRMTLLQADSVWEQYLEQTERLLTMRQYAVAVMGLMETSLQLQNLHHPWLALLRRPAANE